MLILSFLLIGYYCCYSHTALVHQLDRTLHGACRPISHHTGDSLPHPQVSEEIEDFSFT